jgi:hypothetical protein
MSIPGFTAEASIGPTTQVYRVQDRYGTAMASGLYPQLNGGDMDFGGEEDLDNEAAMEMAEDLAGAELGEDLDNEAAMEMAEDLAGADDDLEGEVAV